MAKSIHGSMHVNTFTCFRSLARTSQLLKYVHDFSRWLDERMSLTYIIYMLQIPRWLPPDIFLSVTGLPRGVSVLQDFIIIMTRLGWLRIYTYRQRSSNIWNAIHFLCRNANSHFYKMAFSTLETQNLWHRGEKREGDEGFPWDDTACVIQKNWIEYLSRYGETIVARCPE